MEENRIVNEYTQDGTVDLKGKPVLKSKTGGWKACSFIVGSLSLTKFYDHFHVGYCFLNYFFFL